MQIVFNFTKFLSTPSARRATWWGVAEYVTGAISIHALREEGDPRLCVRSTTDM